MAKPRLYLFHGNDSRSSHLDMQRWASAFLVKYGNVTHYVVEADEAAFEEIAAQLQQALETQSLFADPRFVLVKRTSATLAPTRVKEITQLLGKQMAGLNDQITVVFWEDRLLPAAHPLHAWFAEHALRKQAEVKTYNVGTPRALVDSITRRKDVTLDAEAAVWLEQHARHLERQQRIAAKLRANDALATDWRVWNLEHLIEAAALLAKGAVVHVGHVEQAAGLVVEAVSPFEIINAVQSEDWTRARKLARQWDESDESAYFGLVALLRNHFRKPAGAGREAFREYALELLAEIEVLSKNVSLKQAWLLDLFLTRCEQFTHESAPLVNPRRLWLSHVQRVE